MIFKYCLKIVDGRSPRLLVAVRGDRELYEQALEVYYRVNYITLDTSHDFFDHKKTIESLPAKTLSKLKTLMIQKIGYLPQSTIDFLQEKTSIETVLMSYAYFWHGKETIAKLVKGLKSVSRVYAEVGVALTDPDVLEFQGAFGIPGKFIGQDIDGMTMVWCWQAEKGKVLTWNK